MADYYAIGKPKRAETDAADPGIRATVRSLQCVRFAPSLHSATLSCSTVSWTRGLEYGEQGLAVLALSKLRMGSACANGDRRLRTRGLGRFSDDRNSKAHSSPPHLFGSQ